MVEPVDPFEGGELDGLERAPGPAPADDLGLVEAVDRLGRARCRSCRRRCRPRARCRPRRGARCSGSRRTATPRSLWWTRPPPCAGRRSCSACSSASSTKPVVRRPADTRQPTMRRAIGIDDEGDVDEALPGRDVGEVRHPQRVRPLAPGTAGSPGRAGRARPGR